MVGIGRVLTDDESGDKEERQGVGGKEDVVCCSQCGCGTVASYSP